MILLLVASCRLRFLVLFIILFSYYYLNIILINSKIKNNESTNNNLVILLLLLCSNKGLSGLNLFFAANLFILAHVLKLFLVLIKVAGSFNDLSIIIIYVSKIFGCDKNFKKACISINFSRQNIFLQIIHKINKRLVILQTDAICCLDFLFFFIILFSYYCLNVILISEKDRNNNSTKNKFVFLLLLILLSYQKTLSECIFNTKLFYPCTCFETFLVINEVSSIIKHFI